MLREDVVTIDEFLMEYERDILTINGKTWDVESFFDRLNRYFDIHQSYYQSEPTSILYFIENHL